MPALVSRVGRIPEGRFLTSGNVNVTVQEDMFKLEPTNLDKPEIDDDCLPELIGADADDKDS